MSDVVGGAAGAEQSVQSSAARIEAAAESAPGSSDSDRLEVLGLLLVVGAVAYLLAGFSSGWESSHLGATDVGFGLSEGMGGTDWTQVFAVAAISTGPPFVLLGAFGYVLTSRRRYAESSWASRVANWITVPLGIVGSLLAGYLAVRMTFASQVTDAGISFGAWHGRGAGALLYLASGLANVYVAWCAFDRLPVARTPGPA